MRQLVWYPSQKLRCLITVSKSESTEARGYSLQGISRACWDGIWGSGCIAPRILNLDTRRYWRPSSPDHFTPEKNPSQLSEQKAGWTPEPVLTTQRRGKSFSPVENRTTIPHKSNPCSGHYDYSIPAPRIQRAEDNRGLRCPGQQIDSFPEANSWQGIEGFH